jgi:predicted anti-sigma-YlaC factor YlaD
MMLNCREISEHASDFLDAALPFRVRLQMWLHLLMCHICREYVRQMALVVRTLRRLPTSQPPRALQTELLAMFRGEP